MVVSRSNEKRSPGKLALELTGRNYLSYSAVATYLACPQRYYYRYIERLPEETVPASLAFGGAIHRAIEAHYRGLLECGEPPSFADLLAAYAAAWREFTGRRVQFGRSEDRQSLDQTAERVLSAFQTSEFARPAGHIVAIEEELVSSVIPGCPDILARIDLLIDRGDELALVDFKTSRSRWHSEQATYG
jgi:putative RecB family exonuclease